VEAPPCHGPEILSHALGSGLMTPETYRVATERIRKEWTDEARRDPRPQPRTRAKIGSRCGSYT
jgi:hypothetical protein